MGRLPGEMDPGELRDVTDAAVLMAAASAAGIFRALADGPADASEVAGRLGYDGRAVRIVLHALADEGFLIREGERTEAVRFRLTERAARELADPSSPEYRGAGLPHWLRSVEAQTRLGDVLRRGGPLEARRPRRGPEQVARFAAAMAAAPRDRVERIVALCLERVPDARSILDVGGGPGHMTRVFLERGLVGTLFDTEDMIRHAVEHMGAGEVPGLTPVAGDFTRDPLPAGPFDVVLLSNVLHIYDAGTCADVVGRAARVTSPGGVVAVAEFLRGRSRRAGHLGVQMLLRSEAGDCYTEGEITSWLIGAGLVDVRVDALDAERYLLTARRP